MRRKEAPAKGRSQSGKTDLEGAEGGEVNMGRIMVGLAVRPRWMLVQTSR